MYAVKYTDILSSMLLYQKSTFSSLAAYLGPINAYADNYFNPTASEVILSVTVNCNSASRIQSRGRALQCVSWVDLNMHQT